MLAEVSSPFGGPWLSFLDGVRFLSLFIAACCTMLLLALGVNAKMRHNHAWVAAMVAFVVVNYSVAYTEWDRLGFGVGHSGRLWANSLYLVAECVFISYSYAIKDSEEGTLFERWLHDKKGKTLP